MNGFALGGAAEGFLDAQKNAISQQQVNQQGTYQQGMLQLLQQKEQHEQQRQLHAQADKDIGNIMSVVKSAIDAAQQQAAISGQPFDASKVTKAVMPMVQQAGRLADSAGSSGGSTGIQSQFSIMLGNAQAITSAKPQSAAAPATPAPSAPTGTPAAPGQNITSGQVTGVDYGPVENRNAQGQTISTSPAPQISDADRLTDTLMRLPDSAPDNMKQAVKLRLAEAIKRETPEASVHFMKTEDGDEIPLVIKKQGSSISITDTQGNPYVAPTGDEGKDRKAIGDAIIDGKQPPVLTGLYRKSAGVRSYLSKQGFDLSSAQLEWKAAQDQIKALNSNQMTRFVGLGNSVVNTIDEVKNLSDQMKNGGVPLLNAAKLQAYIQTQGNSAQGKLATRYLAAVNTLKEEFANLANGGYAPTEAAWALANQQINGNYGNEQMIAALGEVQRLIRYRLNAVPNMAKFGPGSSNSYTGGAPTGGQEQPKTSGAVDWQSYFGAQ